MTLARTLARYFTNITPAPECNTIFGRVGNTVVRCALPVGHLPVDQHEARVRWTAR